MNSSTYLFFSCSHSAQYSICYWWLLDLFHSSSAQELENYRRLVERVFQAECFDLLVPYVGELVGGSLRERDADVVRSRGGDSSSLDWYYELRANGRQPPSAGFGVGMERFMQSLFGIVSIKDAIPFPRWYLLIELLFDTNATGVVTDSAIYSAICKQIATLYGDFGFAAAKSSLAIKVFDSEAATSIIRVSVESLNRLLASIPFVNSIANVPVVIKLLFIGNYIVIVHTKIVKELRLDDEFNLF
ncbi:unnamed protein product [Anisakis simplex]|uniref:Ribonuclease P/MRP protein subunit POP5 n=1 Tax=Anisakis simplex TaxID=6269 RepID=A0A0M3KCX1_ANISI|nr:unnamed protein product [Anisakis simplex]